MSVYLFPSAWLKQSWKSVCIKNLKPSNGDIHAKGEKRLTRCDDTAFQPYQNCVAQTRTVAHTQRYLIVSISTQCSYRNFDPRLEKQDPRHYSCYTIPVMTPRCLSFLSCAVLFYLAQVCHRFLSIMLQPAGLSPGGYFILPMRRIFATELIFEITNLFRNSATQDY